HRPRSRGAHDPLLGMRDAIFPQGDRSPRPCRRTEPSAQPLPARRRQTANHQFSDKGTTVARLPARRRRSPAAPPGRTLRREPPQAGRSGGSHRQDGSAGLCAALRARERRGPRRRRGGTAALGLLLATALGVAVASRWTFAGISLSWPAVATITSPSSRATA